MELEHQFTVPVPVGQAWDVLLDVERIAPCMPGATVDSFDGETIVGKVKVKVGPIQVTYAGTAKFTDQDASARRAVIEANAKEARGTGTAVATITAVLTEHGGSSTAVTVTTDLSITGKPAQFGRGVLVEVGNKILGRFADCLADELGTGGAAPVPAAAGDGGSGPTAGSTPAAAAAGAAAVTATPGPVPAPVPRPVRADDAGDAIDLLDTAGLPVLKRLAPLVAGLLLVLLVWRRRARRRH